MGMVIVGKTRFDEFGLGAADMLADHTCVEPLVFSCRSAQWYDALLDQIIRHAYWANNKSEAASHMLIRRHFMGWILRQSCLSRSLSEVSKCIAEARSAGGAAGGPAVAVATGMAYAAISSDACGTVRAECTSERQQ